MAGDKTIDEVVDTCHRGDWLLWLAKKVEIDLRLLTLAKGHCAATVLHLIKDKRSLDAVKAAIDFGNGKIDRGQLDAASAAASAAYAAAYAAASAAYAAASAAYAAADATYAAASDAYAAARKENQKQTADICRKYIGEEIKRLVKNQIEKEK